MAIQVKRPEVTPSYASKVYTPPRKFHLDSANVSDAAVSESFAVPTFHLDDDETSAEYVLVKYLAKLWRYPSSYQIINKIKSAAKGKAIDKESSQIKYSNTSLNKSLLAEGLINASELKFKLAYINISWLYGVLDDKSLLTNPGDDDAFDEVKSYVLDNVKRRRLSKSGAQEPDNEFKITVNQIFPQYGDSTGAVDFTHSTFNTLTNSSKYNYYSATPGFNKYVPNSKMNASELETMVKDSDHADVDITTTSADKEALAAAAAAAEAEAAAATSSTAGSAPGAPGSATGSSSAATGAKSSTPATSGGANSDPPRRRKPLGRSKKYNTNIDPNSIDLTESLIPGQGFIPEFNINHLCKVPNYYITTSSITANNIPGGISLTTPTNTGAATPFTSSSTPINNISSNSQNFPAVGPPLKKSVSSLFGGSSFFNDGTLKLSKNIQQLVQAEQNDNSISKYYYTMTYRGPGSGNYKDAALINKINKIPTISPANPQRILKVPHKTLAHVAHKKLDPQSKLNSSVKGFVHNSFTKELISDTLERQSNFVADCQNLEMLHNNLQFNVLLNAYREISDDTWDNYYKFKLIDFDQLGMKQRERARLDAYEAAVEAAKLDAIDATKKAEEEAIEEAKSIEEIKQAHTEAVAEAEENGTTPPPSPEIPEPKYQLPINPIQPVLPTPPPQFRLSSRFVEPSVHPEILRKIPVELRDTGRTKEGISGDTVDDIPNIKEPLNYINTYPDLANPHLLTQVEIVKLPNANNIGWGNIKSYRN